MNQLVESVIESADKLVATVKAKNADYAGSEDPYKNFTSAQRLNLPVSLGMMVRLQDKVSRLENFFANPDKELQVKDESIDDTLLDLAGYALIIRARRQYEKEQ